MSKQRYTGPLERINDTSWRIPKSYRPGMRVDGIVYADDVLIVRKLGHPHHEEYAMGAIASGGIRVMNAEAERYVKRADVDRIAAREQVELERRELLYRGDAPPLVLSGRVVVLVDDGLATGSTMRAAARAVRQKQPAWTCIAVPVGAPETCEALRAEAD